MSGVVSAGAAYDRGWLTFRGQRFRINRHVYLTDPETSALVDAVARWAHAFGAKLGRPPLLLEFGVGCGALSVSLARELGGAAKIVAVDVEDEAVDLARENAAAHRASVEIIRSDFFDALGSGVVPDLIFGDPPWGDETTLYAADRDAAHYNAMPAAATYPLHGRTGMHEEILRRVRARGWSLECLLNFGVLDEDDFAAVAPLCDYARIIDGRTTRILYAGIGRSTPLFDAGAL